MPNLERSLAFFSAMQKENKDCDKVIMFALTFFAIPPH